MDEARFATMLQMTVAGLGVRIPSDMPLYLSLTWLYGVGRRTAVEICLELGLDPRMRAEKLTHDELVRLSRRLAA